MSWRAPSKFLNFNYRIKCNQTNWNMQVEKRFREWIACSVVGSVFFFKYIKYVDKKHIKYLQPIYKLKIALWGRLVNCHVINKILIFCSISIQICKEIVLGIEASFPVALFSYFQSFYQDQDAQSKGQF